MALDRLLMIAASHSRPSHSSAALSACTWCRVATKSNLTISHCTSPDTVTPSSNHWDRGKAALDQRVGIAPWRLHDLRRTCATQLGELGTQPHHIEAILNHYSGHRSGVAGVYQRAKYATK
jgi:hypothetical protein